MTRALDQATARATRSLRLHVYALPAAALVVAAFVWMVTCDTGDLLGRESFGGFYDAQARSMLAKRWDVPRQAILDEAFLRDGKAYGYFGFAPALLHLPLVLLWPGSDGRWSRLSETAACCVSLWYAYQLLLRARTAFGLAPQLDRRSKILYSLFLISVGLGSSLIFMASEAYIFHEAIIWGAAFSLGSYDYLARYFTTGRLRWLICACVLGFLAFFSRGSVGAGALAAQALTAVSIAAYPRSFPKGGTASPDDLHAGAKRRQKLRTIRWARRRAAPDPCSAPESGAARGSFGTPRPAWHAGLASGAVAVTLGVFVAINYAKFRTFFDAAPLRLYAQMQSNPQRLNRVAGKQVSLSNVRSGARAYLSPARIEFHNTFPWVFATRNARVYPEARYDLIEPYASLPASAPAACALAIAGVIGAFLLRRRSGHWPFILMIGSLAGAAAPLAADALTFRYLHDMFPFAVIAGSFGLNAILLLPRITRRMALAFLLPAAMFGIWANVSIAIVYQRVIVNGTPGDCQKQFKDWQRTIDRYVGTKLANHP